MKIARLKIIGTAVIAAALVTLIFLVSGAAQTEPKFTDAATYYRTESASFVTAKRPRKSLTQTRKRKTLSRPF